MQTDRLVQQLEKYELNEKEANVWLYLLKQGVELSVVDIAHGLELGRTPVYNALDRLEAKGLVKHIISPVGFRFAALEPHNLRRYWDDLT
ncbi:MAG: helix-turn-helix domain-containing protein, partial [Candidatus Nomurabacteria bacterium]|nr:helix-turn-helix domain-containing protein [Candidatus Nomurabacteria bacterium]